MEEYVGILRNGNLIGLAAIDVIDRSRKRKNDVALCTTRRKCGSHNIDTRCHVRSHYSSHRRVTELPLRIHQEHEKG